MAGGRAMRREGCMISVSARGYLATLKILERMQEGDEDDLLH